MALHLQATDTNTQTALGPPINANVVDLQRALTGMGLHTVSHEISEIKVMVSDTKQKQSELEVSLAYTQQDHDLTKSNVTKLTQENHNLRQRLEFSENHIAELEKRYISTKEHLIDTQFHTMKDNLVFHQIPETKGENTREVLFNFMVTSLKVDPNRFLIKDLNTATDTGTIWIKRCHRFGQAGPRNRPRPIVAVFIVGKDIVMKHVRNLAGTKFFVAPQTPPEISENRNKIAPVYNKAKAGGEHPKYIQKGDVVLLNNKTFKAPTLPMCKARPQTIIENLNMFNLHTSQIITEKGSKFMAHIATVNSRNEVAMALSAIKHTHHSIAGATHNMFGARITAGQHIEEYSDDDGEFTGARHIMRELRRHNITNHVIVITRWYGGVHLGQKRFSIISECTNTAIKEILTKSQSTSSISGQHQSARSPQTVGTNIQQTPSPEIVQQLQFQASPAQEMITTPQFQRATSVAIAHEEQQYPGTFFHGTPQLRQSVLSVRAPTFQPTVSSDNTQMRPHLTSNATTMRPTVPTPSPIQYQFSDPMHITSPTTASVFSTRPG